LDGMFANHMLHIPVQYVRHVFLDADLLHKALEVVLLVLDVRHTTQSIDDAVRLSVAYLPPPSESHFLDYTKQDEKQNSGGEGVQSRIPSRKLILPLYTNLCFCRMLNA
jgi:hypothetical protein